MWQAITNNNKRTFNIQKAFGIFNGKEVNLTNVSVVKIPPSLQVRINSQKNPIFEATLNRNTWKLTLTPNGKLGAIKSKLKNLNPQNKQATFYQVMKENNLKSVSGQKNFNSLLNVLANNPTRHKNVITKVYNTVYKTSKRAKKKNNPLLGPVKPQGKKTQQEINKKLTAGMSSKQNPVKVSNSSKVKPISLVGKRPSHHSNQSKVKHSRKPISLAGTKTVNSSNGKPETQSTSQQRGVLKAFLKEHNTNQKRQNTFEIPGGKLKF